MANIKNGDYVLYNTERNQWLNARVIGVYELWLWLDVDDVGLVTVQNVNSLVFKL